MSGLLSRALALSLILLVAGATARAEPIIKVTLLPDANP